jgi:hypothetical protein
MLIQLFRPQRLRRLRHRDVRLQEEMETTEAFLRSINSYAGADRLLESVESRLNELYRELRIHRESVSRARPSTNDVIEAEYSESSASKP